MFRYVGFVWDEQSRVQAQTAQLLATRLQQNSAEWRAVVEQPGLKVLCAGVRSGSSESYVLEQGAGVVLGTLFDSTNGRHGDFPKARLRRSECASILNSEGRELVTAYWGRYVAFIYDRKTAATRILRDPTGHLPCLLVSHRDIRICFSRVEDCLALQLPRFSINWDYVAAYVLASFVQSEETGLNEVSEIQAGECVTICRNGISRRFYWDPLAIAQQNIVDSRLDAVPALRQTAKACVHAWASCYEGILHHLSGGLDSSIVLGCLRDAPTRPRITCVNYHSPIGGGDERLYARLAAARAGCDLVERERDFDVKLEPILHVARSERPLLIRNRNVQVDRLESQLAGNIGATALFGGEGGDQLFYQNPVMLIASDYVHHRGLRPGIFKVAMGVARLDNSSVWVVLRKGIRNGLVPRRWNPLEEPCKYRKLVSRAVIDDVTRDNRFLHPWFRDTDGMPHGKLWHIFMLSFPQQFYSPLGQPDDPEPVEPLTSQPLLELCLRIPTYVLSTGGLDRAIARQAFAEDVPEQILRRTTKGVIEGYVKEMIMRNVRFVRELLLDGILVKEGMLDRSSLEEALSGRPGRVGSAMAEILDHLTTESWARNWAQAREEAAA